MIWWDIPDLMPGDAVDKAFQEIEKRVKELIKLEKSGGDIHELDDNIDEEQD